jgi:putative oxidoreductase
LIGCAETPRASGIGAQPAANTSPTALFLCCFAKHRRFCCGGMLSLQGATRYELSASELLGEVKMNENFLAAYRPQLLSLFRFITGLLLLQYGIAKIFKFPVLPYFANIPPLITAAGAIELVGGALLLLGLFTRPVAFILAGEMAFAYFLGHMFKVPDAPVFLPLNNGGTAAILFCFACLYLATAGGGPWSLDAMMRKKS